MTTLEKKSNIEGAAKKRVCVGWGVVGGGGQKVRTLKNSNANVNTLYIYFIQTVK